MERSFTLHDYDNCLVNLANSVIKRFIPDFTGRTLDRADEYLKTDHKNIVVLLLDGLGTCI